LRKKVLRVVKNPILKNSLNSKTKVLSQLLKKNKDVQIQNDILALISRINDLKREIRLGTISFENEKIERNKIEISFLEQVNRNSNE
jgi:hypothetical protein